MFPTFDVPNEEEQKKQEAVKNYLLSTMAQKAQPASPESNFGLGDAIATGVAGLGDAMSAAAGRNTNFKQDVRNIKQSVTEQQQKNRELGRTVLEEQDMDDPNSDTSRQYQALAAKFTKRDPNDFAGISATKLKNIIPVSEKLFSSEIEQQKNEATQKLAEATLGMRQKAMEMGEKRLSALEDERGEKRKDEYAKRQSSVIDKFNADPAVKKSQQSIDAAATIRDLAESGNPIAAGAIPTYSARMSGEVGNLSEADKRPFGGSRAILTRMDAALQEMTTGKLSDQNKKFILELSHLIEKRANENKANIARNRAQQYSQIPNYGTADELFKILAPEINSTTGAIASSSSQNPNVMTAVNKKTGQKIQSTDGGKTWQPAQ